MRRPANMTDIARAGDWWEEAAQYFEATLVGFDGLKTARYRDSIGETFTLTGPAREALERFIDANSAGG